MQFRQGDVLLELVESVPPSACRIAAPTRQLLVASGKDGTHAHVLDAKDPSKNNLNTLSGFPTFRV
jgi:hypothetical protein